jgi:enamine deaminase RidA (YjgF/YER057c/UK114 family)
MEEVEGEFVITDKNREAIKELDTLVKECNTLLDEWAATGSVSEDQKLYVWNLWNKMGKIVMGSKFKVYRPEKRS